MLAFRTDMPQTCGILELDGRGVVHAFHEKVPNPPGNLANAAVYVCDPEITDFIVGLGKPFVDFSTEVIPRFLGRILSVETQGYHRDIGSPEALRLAELEFQPPAPVN
jgi:mannose-1-phosphate guanylyltransferase